jgi:hypothetical protein
MAFLLKQNNAKTTINMVGNLGAGVTTLVVTNGAIFPVSGDFMLTLWDKVTYPDPGDDAGMEIVRATARTGNSITIVRGQEGTADVLHSNGENVELLITALSFTETLDQNVKTTDGPTHTGLTLTTTSPVYTGTARPQRSFFVGAAGMWPSGTSGCSTITRTETATNKVNYYSLSFSGTATNYAEFSCSLPKNWDAGTITYVLHYIPTGTTGGTGIVWGLEAVCIGDNVNIDTAFGAQVTVTDAIQTANYVHLTPESGAVTIAGTLTGEKSIHWRVARMAAAAGDTNTDAAKLLGVLIKFTSTQETDD